MHPNYRADIDGLRAVAVLPVLLFHAFPTVLPGGFTGVDVFFVISGFLISQILIESLSEQRFSLLLFYAKRIRRIFPALITVLTACLAFGWFALTPEELKLLGAHLVGGSTFVSNLLLWRESGYFDVAAETKPLLHLWSLGIEEQFYIIWPLILWLSWRLKLRFFWVTLGLLLVSFAINIVLYKTHAIADFYSPLSRFWELLLGASLTAYMASSWPQKALLRRIIKPAQHGASFIGYLLLISSFIIINPGPSFPGYWALMPTFGALLIVGAGPCGLVNQYVLCQKIVVWFGKISYPLYLWHWPILAYLRTIEGETPVWTLRAGGITASIIAAWLTMQFIERPLRFGPNGQRKAMALCAAMLVVGLAGLLTYYKDGFPERAHIQNLHAQAQDLTRLKADISQDWICNDPVFKEGYCSLDENRKPTALILGDSHAQALYWGLRDVFRDEGQSLALVGSNGCTPFPDLATELNIHERKRQCPEKAVRVIDEAISNPDIKLIMIALRNVPYISGTGFGEIEKDSTTAVWLKDELPGQRTQTEAYSIALERLLTQLLQANKKVVFFQDVPELGFDIKRCLDKRPFQFRAQDELCVLPRRVFENRAAEFREMSAPLLARFPSVQVIDLANLVCDREVCPVKVNGRLLYEDDDHLSNYGASLVARKIQPLILWDLFKVTD